MKRTLIALGLATLVAAPAFAQSAAAAALHSARFEQTYDGADASHLDLTQSGPIHRGPNFRGYPLSDWYIY
jgi:hypothetical protein